MAPEVVNGVKYDMKADCWSFGVILFYMLSGTYPFKNADEINNNVPTLE